MEGCVSVRRKEVYGLEGLFGLLLEGLLYVIDHE